jgi:hypothetical protein
VGGEGDACLFLELLENTAAKHSVEVLWTCRHSRPIEAPIVQVVHSCFCTLGCGATYAWQAAARRLCLRQQQTLRLFQQW